ncbi:MAG: ABC transporter permease subunit, partial [bacterium]|jgi:NitT/TauT family transport system permease protein|nr:ABC transporter permease subunit [bacterium]
MDEPFGALDSQTRMALQADLMRIWSSEEQTILFITHDLTEAISLSDSIVVMSQRPGTVRQIFDVPLDRPRDVFAIQTDPHFAEVYNSVWQSLRHDVLAAIGEGEADAPTVRDGTRPAHPQSPRVVPGGEAQPPSGVQAARPQENGRPRRIQGAREATATLPSTPRAAPAPKAARQASGLLSRLRTVLTGNANLYRVLILVAVLVAWEVAADTGMLNVIIFSHPLGVLDTLRTLLSGEAISGANIYEQIRVTLSEMVIGFAIGGTIGVGLGFWLGRARLLARVLQPFILASYGVPIIAIAPIFILVLGIGFPSKVGIATITAFFVIFFNTYAGVGAMPEEHLQLARIMGASRSRVVRRVMIPATLPFIFNGLRMAVPFSMTGAVIGEFVASSSGLGWYIVRATGAFDASGLFAGLIVMLVIVWALGQIVGIGERYFLRWRPQREASARTAPRV